MFLYTFFNVFDYIFVCIWKYKSLKLSQKSFSGFYKIFELYEGFFLGKCEIIFEFKGALCFVRNAMYRIEHNWQNAHSLKKYFILLPYMKKNRIYTHLFLAFEKVKNEANIARVFNRLNVGYKPKIPKTANHGFLLIHDELKEIFISELREIH